MPVGRFVGGETVTASLPLVFKWRGRILAPPLIKSINNLLPSRASPREKKTVRSGKYQLRVAVLLWISRHFNSSSSSEHCSRNRLNAVTKLSRMSARRKSFSLTSKKAANPAGSDACRLCGVNFKIPVGDFGEKNKYILTQNLPWKGWSSQNSRSRSFEHTSWRWTGSKRWKVFPWTRNSLFLLSL